MFIEIIFIVSFMSVSMKVKMSDSDEDPEITSELKKDEFKGPYTPSVLFAVLVCAFMFLIHMMITYYRI
jgi:hypothetical protein